MLLSDYMIQQPTNGGGGKTLSFCLAEYIAFSAIEDVNDCFYDRIAVVEFLNAASGSGRIPLKAVR